jgi:alpha-L-rhamnosidase
MSCPYDCPQRDERLGWLGDAHVTADTCLYNFDMRRYYDKWLEDIRVNMHAETGVVPHIVPWHNFEETAIDFATGYAIVLWEHYLFYRDPSILAQHCDALIKFTDYMTQFGPILEKTRYGDWMSLAEGWTRGDPACSASLFYYYMMTLLIKVLTVLGRNEELTRYTAIAEDVKKAIVAHFYDAENKSFDDNTQFSLAFALKLGLIPEEDEQAVLARLVADIRAHDDHLTTGIFGTKFLMSTLEKFGQYDVAMRLILQKTFPSWLNMIEGRTTLPEQWDGGLEALKSQNHCMFGSVDSIFYSMLAGIRPKDDCVVIDPYFAPEMNRVKAKTVLAGGSITVEWNRTEQGIILNVEVNGAENVFFRGERLGDGLHSFTA